MVWSHPTHWRESGGGGTTSWPLCFDVLGSHRNYDRYDTFLFFFLNATKPQKAGGKCTCRPLVCVRSACWYVHVFSWGCCCSLARPICRVNSKHNHLPTSNYEPYMTVAATTHCSCTMCKYKDCRYQNQDPTTLCKLVYLFAMVEISNYSPAI